MITHLHGALSHLKKQFYLVLTLSCFSIFSMFAQNDNQIEFQGELVNMPENIGAFQWSQMPQTSFYNGGYYGWLRFDETPVLAIQEDFRIKGYELIDYIPNKVYLFYMPSTASIDYLEGAGVKSIIPVAASLKQSYEVKHNLIESWAMSGNKVLLNLHYHKGVQSDLVIQEISRISGLAVREVYKTSNVLEVAIPYAQVNDLAEIPFIKYMELVPPPPVKDDDRGRSLHRSSNLDTQTLTGRNYTGEGVGVMVRDDGVVGPHIDFQGRINNSQADGSGPTHGDGVAGILAGAGNLDPTKRGMAAGAEVYITNYASSFLDAATTGFINSGEVQITNSSYSNGCNSGYTTSAQTVDSQSNSNTSLLHVFSGGNSNGSDCGYGAGTQWGNITGGHKQGKNVIATANVFYEGTLANSSSRGPAYDGRIKPDITAHGQGQLSTDENNGYFSFGGTSGAAPGIAGVSAQLYQAYMDLNGGTMPEAALIKAALLNTANDYGNVGPDFSFGWGMVNGLRAVKLLEDNRYLSASISQGVTNNHSITIPVGTKQLKVMLYWNDVAATTGASLALVNDLDLTVMSPQGNSRLPWVLDPTPNAFQLNFPAVNGVDRLNNMEQVQFDDPSEGTYTVNISGFNVPSGVQDYFLVYEVITENLVLTYPSGGEKMTPGEVETLHWDQLDLSSPTITLEYSTDNGINWISIATISSNSRNYDWTLPNVVSGECLVRITSGSDTYISDNMFSISNQVSGITVDQVCPTELVLSWDNMANATEYDVYLLGERYMEVVHTATTNSASVSITDPLDEFWIAITAKGGNGWESRRTVAINQPGGLFNCTLFNDVLVESLNNDLNNLDFICSGNDSILVSANISNLGENNQTQGFSVSYQLDSNPVVQETFTGTLAAGAQAIYEFSTPLEIPSDGDYVLKVRTSLPGDEFLANDGLEMPFTAQLVPVDLNLIEDFDSGGMPPAGWRIDNADDAITWEEAITLGSDGNNTSAAFINNYNYSDQGQLDIIETHVFNLDGTNLMLNFDIAKAQYSASFNDGLRVEISVDCGLTFVPIFEEDGLDLSTISSYSTGFWAPSSANDWRTESIDLTAFEGNIGAIFRFVNINGFGNTTLIDNINVAGLLSIDDNSIESQFALFPNPASDSFRVKVSNQFVEEITIYDLFGKVVLSRTEDGLKDEVVVNSSGFAPGMYLVGIDTDRGSAFKKLMIK